MDAAIGFVVARGDRVERARLSWLRAGVLPQPEVLTEAESGQSRHGGWPATWNGHVASVDATCFRLAELDDLGALGGDAARLALDWLARSQRPDGTWEEDEALAEDAPAWARPGDLEARLYLTANAAYWLTVAAADAADAAAAAATPLTVLDEPPMPYADELAAAAEAIRGALRPDGTWPSFLVTGWLGAAVLHRREMYYESARMQVVLAERVPRMSPADTAWMAAALRRAGVRQDDWLMVAARRRLAETQRSDGGWPSDDGEAFDVHVTLAAIRACR
jgi:Prenyltransferase and squalene oxidase repeat